MHKAYERKEEFSSDGKCLRREWSVGAIVPWALVVLVAILRDVAMLPIPPSLLEIFKR